jgi:hypothetical protein
VLILSAALDRITKRRRKPTMAADDTIDLQTHFGKNAAKNRIAQLCTESVVAVCKSILESENLIGVDVAGIPRKKLNKDCRVKLLLWGAVLKDRKMICSVC